MCRSTIFCMLSALLFTASHASTTRFRGYTFESYVISDIGYRYGEISKQNGTWIQVDREDEYALVINNPLPVRVAVAVSIDGLNVIDGKRTSADKGQKWIIDANGSITLRGWQTDRSSLRRFIFTDKEDSYAEWKGNRDRKTYTRNLGVIGVAYFWNSTELNNVLHPFRLFENRYGGTAFPKRRSAARPAPSATQSMDECASEKARAGTGMGHKETNNVIEVAFHYDTGMYRENDVLAIYYEFARYTDTPRPFADEAGRATYAPEMP
jgi:hypothetical protein